MATVIKTAMVQHSALDGTGDAINGSEVDENSNTIADVLDGTTQSDLSSADRVDFLSSSTHTTTREAIRLINLDAATGAVQDVLRLEWDPGSGTPAASQGIGIVWYMSDSGNNQDEFAYFDVAAATVTAASEDVQIRWGGFIAGTARELVEIGSAGFILNEDGTDLDYRFESDTNANAFTLDAGLFSGVGAIGLAAAATNIAVVLVDPPALTAVASTNISRVNIENTAAITVPAGTTTLATSVFIGEPNLTATGTITSAVTLYIEAAPTEGGTNNYALWVDSGVSAFGGNLVPDANDGAALGIPTLGFSDVHLAAGAVINFANGEITITETDSNTLTIAGVATRFDFAAGILEMNNAIEWDTGVAVVSTEYSAGRDADATNQFHVNVPVGASIEMSIGDAARFVLDASGRLAMALHPMVLATQAETLNVTGDATVYTLTLGTEAVDRGGNFSGGTFTAPIAGQYLFVHTWGMFGIAAGHTPLEVYIVATGRTVYLYSGSNISNAASGYWYDSSSTVFNMAANDTAVVKWKISGGALAVDVDGTNTALAIYLLP